MASLTPAPWRLRKYPDPLEPNTLREWRHYAEKLAKYRGAKHACQICKRPCDVRGRVRVQAPVGRRYVQRLICHGCFLGLVAHIAHLEQTEHLDHLPPERVLPGEDE